MAFKSWAKKSSEVINQKEVTEIQEKGKRCSVMIFFVSTHLGYSLIYSDKH